MNRVGKPDRKPNRWRNFDYSSEAMYFITICVKSKEHFFGKVRNGKMHLNLFGEVAKKKWYWLEEQYSFVRLHAFVVMPNHVHGIIELHRGAPVGTGLDQFGNDTASNNRTGQDLSLQAEGKIKSLSQVVGAFKTLSSKQIRLAGLPEFAWQRSFHDHIIRNGTSYDKINNYIQNNPALWPEDIYNAPSP